MFHKRYTTVCIGKCPHPECQVLPEDRRQCFDENTSISEILCITFGCCYDETTVGSTACYQRKGISITSIQRVPIDRAAYMVVRDKSFLLVDLRDITIVF